MKEQHNSDDVSHRSDASRRDKPDAMDQALERTILRLLQERGAGKSICPSEAARAVDPQDWEPLMEPTRAAAVRLAAEGHIVITQGGRVVDPSRAKGPIRLRKS